MLQEIKNNIEKELVKFIAHIDKTYSLKSVSPQLLKSIEYFMLGGGKRLRPMLFVLSYLGYVKRTTKGLYTTALAIELLHDFMLIHDDIIDKSDVRRGKPSMHAFLNKYLSSNKCAKNIKFNGQDLSIVIGDLMYAIGLHAFLSIQENSQRKERALKKFAEVAIYTCSGEFIELLLGLKDIQKVRIKDILKIYDYKTAYYSFCCPLMSGAILAGAANSEIKKLSRFGICIGRAFQIKDDISGLFGKEKDTGKSVLSDLQESKKTILIWHAYHNSNKAVRLFIRRILSKSHVTMVDLEKIKKIIIGTNSLSYAKKEISRFIDKAERILISLGMRTKYKQELSDYVKELLSV